MLSTRFRRLLLVLFLAALAVRLFGLSWDGGQWFHPDERRIAEAVQELKLRPFQLDPKFFAYGSFPFYVTRAVQGVATFARPSLAGYGGSILVGRGVSALWGALTVALLVLLGRRLYGERTGLLAGLLLAAAVLHLQNSHFATNDVPLTFLVLLALTLLIRAGESRSARDFALAGLVIGVAAATKISALPLFLPLLVAALGGRPGERAGRRVRLLGLAAAAAVIGFAAGEPYALLDFRAFSHDVVEQSRMVRTAGAVPYTTQYMGTPKVLYDLREHVLWGLGPLLGLAGLWGAVRTYRFRSRTVSSAEWILVSFALPFFAVTAFFEVKFLRYLLPLYPLACLWAARWLTEGTDAGTDEGAGRGRRRRKRVLRGTVVAATVLYAAAFLGIYTRPHTVATASRWFYANVPKDSAVLSQDWDEGFPFDVGGHSASEYRFTNFSFYEDDSDEKIRKLAASLSGSQAAVFQTKRLYGAVTQAPGKYPQTDRFFRLLFAGDLGFRLEKEVASRPGFFGLGLPDELADESFSVYDHPKVVIFMNRSHLDAAELEGRILSGAPSRVLTRSQILRAPHGAFANDQRPGELQRSSAGALLLVALFSELLGLAGYAFVRRFVSARPGLYALGKVTGVVAFAFLAWWVVSLGWLPFTRPVLVAAAALLLLAAGALFRGRTPGKVPLREIAWTEAIVWGSFLAFAFVRSRSPEIFWGEKPMDFAFLNTLYRAVSLPLPEPWFAGSALDYTYFGHFTVAAIGKALGVPPALMFNLAIALGAALTAAGLFAAGALLGSGLGTGALAAGLGLAVGNLSGIREVAARHAADFDTFWATSRVVPETINEFPFWSFVFADLHAHVLALPAALGLVSILVLGAREAMDDDALTPRTSAVPLLALGALFLGAAATTNGWGTPTWLSLALLLLLLGACGPAPFPPARRLHRLGGAAGVFTAGLIGAGLLFLPFWTSFTAPKGGFGWEKGPYARPWDVFNHFGLFVVILVPFLYLVVHRALSGGGGRGRASAWRPGLLVLLLPLSLLQWKGALPKLQAAASVRNAAALLAILGFFAAFHPRTAPRHRIPSALAALGFAIVAGCEVVYVWDRMNTVFKFYFDAWLLFAVAGALVARDLAAGLLGSEWGRLAWRSALVAAVAASLATAGIGLAGFLRMNRVGGPRGTLDGMAYLDRFSPDEAALYRWVGKAVPGLPAVAEAWGPSYQRFGRISMNTGLPTVLGWDYHLTQRGKSWAAIDQRKEDLRTLYTSQTREQAAAVLRRYQVRYVVSGPIERQAYIGERSPPFDSFDGLLKPVFRKGGTALYEVSRSWRPPADAVPAAAVPALPTPAGEESPSRTGR